MRIQKELREIQYAEHLPDVTLAVIGLWNMGYTDLATVARLLWIVDLKPLRRLFKMLRTSNNPLIRQFVDVGLPSGVYRQLPLAPGPTRELSSSESRQVRCRLCGRMVNCVPCPECSLKSPASQEFPFRGRWGTPPPASHRTTAAPGSLRKISVMRERVERGEQASHPKDRRIPRNDA